MGPGVVRVGRDGGCRRHGLKGGVGLGVGRRRGNVRGGLGAVGAGGGRTVPQSLLHTAAQQAVLRLSQERQSGEGEKKRRGRQVRQQEGGKRTSYR